MNEKGRPRSCENLTGYDQGRSAMELIRRKRLTKSPWRPNSDDSGFIDEPSTNGVQSVGRLINSDADLTLRKDESESLEEQTTTGLGLGEGGDISEEDRVIKREGLAFSRPESMSSVAEHPSPCTSLESYVEIANACHIETVESRKSEEVILAERVERLSCPPKPPPEYPVIGPPKSGRIKLKWPNSRGLYLRAIYGEDNPRLTVDKYRESFKHQYCYAALTKPAFDNYGQSHYLMCFRHDYRTKSFYLVPKTIPGACPDTLQFTFLEATEDVVLGKLSDDNASFWFVYKQATVLQSLAHPEYYFSLEADSRAVLRRTEGGAPETENYFIDIIECRVEETSSWRKKVRRLLRSVPCVR